MLFEPFPRTFPHPFAVVAEHPLAVFIAKEEILLVEEPFVLPDERAAQRDHIAAEIAVFVYPHIDADGAAAVVSQDEIRAGGVIGHDRVVRVGDIVDVRVISVDEKRKKISLSMKK